MKTFEFTIVASGLDPRAGDFESRFYDRGCDDALVSFQKGHTILDFAREADSAPEAIAAAVADVRAAGATIDRIEPDPLVSLTDIAMRSNLTKAAISNYASGGRKVDFPKPVMRVTTTSPLWEWHGVAHWLWEQERLAREAVLEAYTFKQANELLARNDRDFLKILSANVCAYEAELAA